jgi:2-C-methyl-D-erythritol 4-phosphate cytidylyltransferase/2-C-methyl-D-erythritol 2,4-cyclodiphosphate synthase
MKNIAVILAGGSGQRCGFDKLFSPTENGEIVISQTLKIFQNCPKIDEIILVASTSNLIQAEEFKNNFQKIKKVITGGAERFFSLEKALKFLQTENKDARIIVHNGANPNLKNDELLAGLEFSQEKKSVIFGFMMIDSCKQIFHGKIIKSLNRAEIFQAQTPQISTLETFSQACNFFNQKENNHKNPPQDEAELLQLINEEIFIFQCSNSNSKITTAEDFTKFSQEKKSNITKLLPNNLRLGVGEDSHRFTDTKNFPGKNLIIGGVIFPNEKYCWQANSDGDLILHALCNAILSSVGEPTFDTFASKMCKNGITNSAEYLAKSLSIAQQKFPKFSLQNCIISLEGSRPKISPVHNEIISSLAKLLNISQEKIGLTYTTGENLTDFGKGLGMHCLVEILVEV